MRARSSTFDELFRRVSGPTEHFLPLAMELTDEGSVAKAVAATLAHFGALDVVVNNAGYGQFGTVEEVTDAEARRNYDVNVFGTLNVLRATLPQLREQRSASLGAVASVPRKRCRRHGRDQAGSGSRRAERPARHQRGNGLLKASHGGGAGRCALAATVAGPGSRRRRAGFVETSGVTGEHGAPHIRRADEGAIAETPPSDLPDPNAMT
jgi:NAD(P)-dependent dehydrogenase (short-subunit alcohol dehydrogenase family)